MYNYLMIIKIIFHVLRAYAKICKRFKEKSEMSAILSEIQIQAFSELTWRGHKKRLAKIEKVFPTFL
jgi:hypothetical protein